MNHTGFTANGAVDYAYFGIILTFSISSLLGSSLIITVYVAYIELRTTSRRLLTYLSVSDLISAVAYLMGVVWVLTLGHENALNQEPPTETFMVLFCEFPALMGMFGAMSSCLWTTAIAIYLYMCIVKNDVFRAEMLMWPFHFVCWTVPAVICVAALSSDVLGYDLTLAHYQTRASLCWIKEGPSQLVWQLVSGPGWEIVVFVIIGILYGNTRAYIAKELRSESQVYVSDETMTAIHSANQKLLFVPIVLILLRVWGMVRFLVTDLAADKQEVENNPIMIIIMLLQGAGDSAQGLANCILFCFCTAKVRTQLWRSLQACREHCLLSCRRRRNTMSCQAETTYRFHQQKSKSESTPIVTCDILSASYDT
ncbi:G-protein coupled receptor 157 [Lingula anatina]|uniref:G-protein coupled receptor 157 n=1 Tax=Lingula anatina TaxID=7574 RepID=A0A1S3JQ97_LINAN|nr:G-protein coupled receptor 157 [Lingula anatina]|eukprot:XP_013412134.1 G-protein coupled receptor 157 [Lingula anatina]